MTITVVMPTGMRSPPSSPWSAPNTTRLSVFQAQAARNDPQVKRVRAVR